MSEVEFSQSPNKAFQRTLEDSRRGTLAFGEKECDVEKRSRLYANFAARFAADGLTGPALPCDISELDRAEKELQSFLPVSYRQFLASHGPLFVPELWDIVVGRELPARAPREFLTPAQVVTNTQVCWSGGMPNDFIGVAVDFTGDIYGFRRVAVNAVRPDDLPVEVFDTAEVRIVPVAASFESWIEWFVENVQTAEPSNEG